MLLIFRWYPNFHYAFICWECGVQYGAGKSSINFKSWGLVGYRQGLLGMVP